MKLTRKMSVINRIVLWLIAIALVTFVVLAWIGWEIRDTIRENGLVRLENVLKNKNRALGVYVQQQYSALNDLGFLIYFASRHHDVFHTAFWGKAPESFRQKLSEFAISNNFYDIFVISTQGEVVYTLKEEDDFHTNLLHGKYKDTLLSKVFKDALNSKESVISDFRYYEPSQEYAAFIAEPIREGDKIIGVMAVQIDNHQLQAIVNDDRELGESGEIMALSSQRGETITMAPILNGEIPSFTPIDPARLMGLGIDITAKDGTHYATSRSGNPAAVAWNYQEQLRWVLIATVDEAELLRVWNHQIASMSVLFLIGVFVVLLMVVAALRSFMKPIQVLIDYAQTVSAGNYALRIEGGKYDREWELLLRTFQKMTQEISRKIYQLNGQNLLLEEQKEKIEEFNQTLEQKIEEKSRKLQEYIAVVDENVITSRTDKRGIIVYVSDAFCKISGYTKEELIGKNHNIIRHPDMPDEMFADLWRTITSGRLWHGEIKNRKADGGYYWVDTTITPTYERNEIVGYTAVRHDITYQKLVEELAVTDSMTGLYNRRYYNETIRDELNRAKRHKQTLALLMLDVDHFKQYNDAYGHDSGDEVLVRVAEVLKRYTARSGEYAFRMGGEEFAILYSAKEPRIYLDIAEQIRSDILSCAITHEHNSCASVVTVSIGVAIWNGESDINSSDLYREADRELYRAKESGRNRISARLSGTMNANKGVS
ncbi:MAG: diguanylate cyclase [Sulfuricurvum sp.]